MQSREALVAAIEGTTGYRFQDAAILERAFMHASAASDVSESNERLEFLGDAILGFLTCEILYQTLEHLPEGELTKVKSLVVSRSVCAQIADRLGLPGHLRVGKGMKHGQLPVSVRAAVLECLIGAMLEDGGLECVRPFVRGLMEPEIVRALKAGHHRNFKSVLQQVSQRRGEGNPCFRLLQETGPDHAKSFEVAVELGRETFPSQWAPSKRQAEQAAAEQALRCMGIVVDGPDGEPEVDWTRLPSEDQEPAPAKDETMPRTISEGEGEASAA